MITLGGNIKLDGFDKLDYGMLIVVKKMVGLFARKVSENIGELEAFEVIKEDKKITIKVSSKDKKLEERAEGDNLFMALSDALKAIEDKSKK
ncbi:MAG: hypothetical protein KKA65_02210 [Nanoarchaeota archaeon]|nr:hypothetical protein [Nanoarchaeota archaeon]MBU4351484.1 hypothetical protein [Nanoarchaeota archaeon]MBU4456290.1 hypothetical protein [Nanoarchaeota archaeon]MCG2720140.1 hypothetical protein [Nanoarchaeota archaeon]